MNEQNNAALVKSLYAAFERGDIQTILDSLAPNVEWTLQGPEEVIPLAGTRIGPAQVATFFANLASTQTDHKLTITEYIAHGNSVVTLGHYTGTVTATGKKIEQNMAHVFTIQDGKVTRFLEFGDTAQVADAYRANMAAAR